MAPVRRLEGRACRWWVEGVPGQRIWDRRKGSQQLYPIAHNEVQREPTVRRRPLPPASSPRPHLHERGTTVGRGGRVLELCVLVNATGGGGGREAHTGGSRGRSECEGGWNEREGGARRNSQHRSDESKKGGQYGGEMGV